MLNIRYYRHKRLQKRNVFRQKNNKKPRTFSRQLTIGILYLCIGLYLLLSLNLIPQFISYDTLLAQAWKDILIAVSRLYHAITSIGTVILVVSLILLGLILFLGGLWRLCRLIPRVVSIVRSAASVSTKRNRK